MILSFVLFQFRILKSETGCAFITTIAYFCYLIKANGPDMRFEIKKIWLHETTSTNDYAYGLVNKGMASEGMLIASRFQTKGRGVGNNTWESEGGANLTFSVILSPGFLHPSEQFLLNQCISLAVAGFTDELAGKSSKICIKWPNDIYAGEGKIAGILIQNIIQGNEIRYCIAGTGININQKKFYSDAPNPVSLWQITDRVFDIDQCLDLISGYIETEYHLLMSGAKSIINERYLSRLYRFNTPAEFIAEGVRFSGCIKGVTSFGQLIVLDNTGYEHHFDFKQVAFVY